MLRPLRAVRLVAGALLSFMLFGTASACSSSPSAPAPSEARALLQSCRDLQLPEDPTLTPPVEKRRVQPVPPRGTARSGFACIQATVSVDGRLSNLKVLRTNSSAFVLACMDALKQWQYAPAFRGGSPVPVDTVISLSYSFQ